MNRRQFLHQTSCAAIGSSTLFSTIGNLLMTNRLADESASSNTNYKAMVCVLLAGGNDSFNMLVPRTYFNNSSNPPPGSYDEYKVARANMALSRSSLHTLNYTAGSGLTYGLHPSMPKLRNLFNSDKAAFISNVGTLIHPVPDRSYYNSADLPLGLFSHADQIQQWQTSVPHNRQALGWGGRVADIIQSMNANQNISMNISLDGRNVFQTGNQTFEYAISNEGNAVVPIQKIPSGYNRGILSLLRDQSIDSMVSEMYDNILKSTFSSQFKSSLDVQAEFRNAIAAVPDLSTDFSTSRLSQDLKMTAKSIAAADALGMSRQIYFTTFGGWDLHNDLIDSHAQKLTILDDALSEFQEAMAELNLENNVTTFTISDFGRTMTSNGNGTDHGWGGNQIVIGGAVNGGEIYGEYPPLATTANIMNISRRGILIPQISTDEMFAELAIWFGVEHSELASIFPNLHNFYSSTPGTVPIGFMNV